MRVGKNSSRPVNVRLGTRRALQQAATLFFQRRLAFLIKAKNIVRLQPVKPMRIPLRMKFFSHVGRPGPRVKSACAVLAQGHLFSCPMGKKISDP